MDVKIIYHPQMVDCYLSAKELQGLLDIDAELTPGMSREIVKQKYPRFEMYRWQEFACGLKMDDKIRWNGPDAPTKPVERIIQNMQGSFFSHYQIWEEMEEDTLIFEDDARPVASVDWSLVENFDGDVLNLGVPVPMYTGSNNTTASAGRKQFVDFYIKPKSEGVTGIRKRTVGSHLWGGHAYLLTLKGRDKLCKHVKYGGLIRPNDILVRSEYCDLYDLQPLAFIQDNEARASTISRY